MNPTITITELTIIIAAPNQTPALLTPDFLLGSGIVPSDWELARPPALNPQLSQIAFNNGISITAQPGTIAFTESLTNQENDNLKIPTIAQKYTEVLPNLDYQGVAISPRSFLTFPESDENAARDYLINTLFVPGKWLNNGIAPVRTNLNFSYTLESGQFNLSINEAQLQRPEKPPEAALLFSGNFPYQITENIDNQKQQYIKQLIENWQRDLEVYREIVNRQFLGYQLNGQVLSVVNAP
jgi:hypothetical protein